MPKFIGNKIAGANRIEDNAVSNELVRLTYSQAKLLPPQEIFFSLDTTDRGGKRTLAKRWYRWFARPETILSCDKSTSNMWHRACSL